MFNDRSIFIALVMGHDDLKILEYYSTTASEVRLFILLV